MPPNFNEADVSDKPADIRRRSRLSADRIADIRRRYRCELESLLSVDEGVKKIVDALKAKAELGSTLLVYTSDNGFFHGEHRIPDRKTKIYEESIRVPLLMRGPGIPRGVSVSDLVINADLAPTIVDVANASPGLVMDGLSRWRSSRASSRGASCWSSSTTWRQSEPRAISTPSTATARRSSTT
jgi:N-acetylglucosamine-6-sulfatase